MRFGVVGARYRKLLEAAKDVDAFTRFVIGKYAELQHHLPLNEDNYDDQVSAAERLSFCDHDFFTNHELRSTDCQQIYRDEMRRSRHAVSPSHQQPPSCEG